MGRGRKARARRQRRRRLQWNAFRQEMADIRGTGYILFGPIRIILHTADGPIESRIPFPFAGPTPSST